MNWSGRRAVNSVLLFMMQPVQALTLILLMWRKE
jgi:hypothetical protein